METKKVYIGKYVHHNIDKAAFFRVIKILNNKHCEIMQIDNLGCKDDDKKLTYTVKTKELKEDYI